MRKELVTLRKELVTLYTLPADAKGNTYRQMQKVISPWHPVIVIWMQWSPDLKRNVASAYQTGNERSGDA
ncbi:MAG: hypothetical protein ACR5LF_13325 [Symbiopectobacterium sp.]